MRTDADLTAELPREGAPRTRRRRWRSTFRRLCPVFPWSPLRTMTGVTVSRAGVAMARGRLDGDRFRVLESERFPGPDVAGALAELRGRCDGPVCVGLPDGRSTIWSFEVPSESEAEIEAMLPHLLSGDLPLPLENFAWTWSGRPGHDEGYTVADVHVARIDQLEEFIAPLTAEGLNVVGLVPETWGRARVDAWVGGAGSEADEPVDRSFVSRDEGTPCLAAALAVAGLTRRRPLLPPKQMQRSRRRLAREAAAAVARLVLVAALVWSALAIHDERNVRRHLADLEARLAEQAPRVATLERQYAAVRDAGGRGAAEEDILRMLATLRRQVAPAIHLENLDFVKGRGITLRGVAPSHAGVLEMTEALALDPLWQGVRVTQLRSDGQGGTGRVHFTVQARLERP